MSSNDTMWYRTVRMSMGGEGREEGREGEGKRGGEGGEGREREGGERGGEGEDRGGRSRQGREETGEGGREEGRRDDVGNLMFQLVLPCEAASCSCTHTQAQLM